MAGDEGLGRIDEKRTIEVPMFADGQIAGSLIRLRQFDAAITQLQPYTQAAAGTRTDSRCHFNPGGRAGPLRKGQSCQRLAVAGYCKVAPRSASPLALKSLWKSLIRPNHCDGLIVWLCRSNKIQSPNGSGWPRL